VEWQLRARLIIGQRYKDQIQHDRWTMTATCLRPLTSAQIRAACSLIRWTVDKLVTASALSVATIRRAEGKRDGVDGRKWCSDSPRSRIGRCGVHRRERRRPGAAVTEAAPEKGL